MPIDWDGLVLAPLHAAFGETIDYVQSVGQPFRLTDAVFDRSYVQIQPDDSAVPITVLQTHVGIRIASCPPGFRFADGDLVIARGKTWQVTDEQPDGKGNVVLILALAQ